MTNNLPALVTVSLSSSLRAVCDDRQEWNAGEMRELPWHAPLAVDQRDKGEAKAALPLAVRAATPADMDLVRKWLAALGVMCAGNMPAADAKAKIGVYAPNLDHPHSCFTEETLREAGRAFKWFPSYSEVAEFLDGKARPIKKLKLRLEAVANAPVAERTREGKQWRDMTESERQEFTRTMDNLRHRFPSQRESEDA